MNYIFVLCQPKRYNTTLNMGACAICSADWSNPELASVRDKVDRFKCPKCGRDDFDDGHTDRSLALFAFEATQLFKKYDVYNGEKDEEFFAIACCDADNPKVRLYQVLDREEWGCLTRVLDEIVRALDSMFMKTKDD